MPFFDDYILAPSGQNMALFKASPSGMACLGPLADWRPTSVSSVSTEGWIAALQPRSVQQSRPDWESLLVARIPAQLHELQTEVVALPAVDKRDYESFRNNSKRFTSPEWQTSTHTILCDGRRLWAGGGCNAGAWLAWINLTERNRQWRFVDLSVLAEYGVEKAIDALALSGDSIVAFDNLLMPLYAILVPRNVAIGSTLAPTVVDLPCNFTYEHISQSVANSRFGAYLSSGINYGNVASFISVWEHPFSRDGLSVLQEDALLPHERRFWRQENPFLKSDHQWNYLAISGTRLYVAAGKTGVGIWDFSKQSEIVYRTDLGEVHQVFASDVSPHSVLVCSAEGAVWNSRVVNIAENDVIEPDGCRYRLASSVAAGPLPFSKEWIAAFRCALIESRESASRETVNVFTSRTHHNERDHQEREPNLESVLWKKWGFRWMGGYEADRKAEEEAEAAARSAQDAALIATLNAVQEKRVAIELAISKLNVGIFGVCELCGEMIDNQLLMYDLTARQCRRCQESSQVKSDDA